MTDAARLLARIAGGLTVSAMLMLPTIVGAMSAPYARETETLHENPCGPDEYEAEREAFDPAPRSVAACLELTPEETLPDDEPQFPTAQETRAASPDRGRQEAA